MHALHYESDFQFSDISETQLRLWLCELLIDEFGVGRRVAENIAVGREPDYILRHLLYARHAVETGLIAKSTAGWIVASIRDDWGAPLGFDLRRFLEQAGWTDEQIYQAHHDQIIDLDLDNNVGYIMWLNRKK